MMEVLDGTTSWMDYTVDGADGAAIIGAILDRRGAGIEGLVPAPAHTDSH